MRKRVLMVEDDMGAANSMVQVLKGEGIEHFVVTSTDSAIELFESSEHFDVLLTGLSLPKQAGSSVDPFAGFNLALRFRQEIPDIKVVFSTKLDLSTARGLLPTGLHAPVSFLPKNFLPRDLRRAIGK